MTQYMSVQHNVIKLSNSSHKFHIHSVNVCNIEMDIAIIETAILNKI